MQRYMVNRDKELTDLLKYAAQCKRVYQKLKDVACVTAAVKQSKEKQATATPARKVATSTTTTQTTSSLAKLSSRQLTISKQD